MDTSLLLLPYPPLSSTRLCTLVRLATGLVKLPSHVIMLIVMENGNKTEFNHSHTHTGHTHTQHSRVRIFMAAQTCHFYLFNILPNTRANNLRVASNEWAALLPPLYSPSRLYTLYIPCISVQLCVQAERAEARSENVLAPGLRPVHSRTQLPLPRLFAPPSL